MKIHPGTSEEAAPPRGTMDSLRRIERAQQRLWLLALALLLMLTVSVLVLDAVSIAVERIVSGMSARLADLLSNYEASAALVATILLACAYFYEKLVMVRNQNRELVRALDASTRTLAQRNQQLDTWSQLSHALITKFNLPRLLELIVRTAAEVTQSDCAAVILKEEGNPHLRLAAIHQRGLQMELARRVAAMTIKSGERIFLRPDALPEELDRPDLPWEDLVSLSGAPLLAADNIVGALLVGRVRPNEAFSEEIMDGLDAFASQASIALEKAHLYAENQRQLDRFEKLLDDLRHAQRQLLQSERLSLLGTLAAGVTYAINGPLSAISERAGRLLKQEALDPEAVREEVTAIRKRTAGTQETLRGFLKLCRRSESQSMQPLDLNEIMQRALAVVQGEFRASGIEIIESYGDLPRIDGHGPQLEQVFVDVLLEAAGIARDGGALAVLTAAPESNWVRVGIEAHRAQSDAAEEDGGAGQGPPYVEGYETDLNMAAVEQIVHAHRGRIVADGEAGGGTKFEIWLPLSAPRSEMDSQASGAAARARSAVV